MSPIGRKRTFLAIVLAVLLGQFAAAQSIKRIGPNEVKGLVAARKATILDVRDLASFDAGRIAGAERLDRSKLEDESYVARLKSSERMLILYCACIDEGSSLKSAKVLLSLGVTNLAVLKGGYQAWVATGGPLQRGK